MPVSCIGKIDGWSQCCDVDGSRMLLVIEEEETVAVRRRESCRPGYWPCHFRNRDRRGCRSEVLVAWFPFTCLASKARALAVLGKGKASGGHHGLRVEAGPRSFQARIASRGVGFGWATAASGRARWSNTEIRFERCSQVGLGQRALRGDCHGRRGEAECQLGCEDAVCDSQQGHASSDARLLERFRPETIR